MGVSENCPGCLKTAWVSTHIGTRWGYQNTIGLHKFLFGYFKIINLPSIKTIKAILSLLFFKLYWINP
jgi:hypothetical protein